MLEQSCNCPITGLGTALVTPFHADGSVDYPALQRLLDKQITGGVDYIVVLGTTGEAVTLSTTEREQVRRFICDYVAHHPSPLTGKPLPLVLGVGGNCTAAVLNDIAMMREELMASYAAILSVCPYYNKPSQEGLFQHFSSIAEVSPIPVILYNVPGRTGVNLLPETVARLHECFPDTIIAIKEASGNLEQIKHLISLSPIHVISGDDGIAAEVIQAGGSGLISVASNAWPEDFRKIVHEADATLQADYAERIKLLFKEGNPSGIKTVLNQMGLIENVLRLPLVPNSAKVQEEIRMVMASR